MTGSEDVGAPPEGGEHTEPSLRAQRIAALVRWLLIAAFAVLAALGSAIGLGWIGGDAGGAAGAAGSGAGAAATFHCPMHPQITSGEPGSCPICGMDLVPIPGGAAGAGSSGTGSAHGPTKRFCPRHPEIRSDVPGRCPLDGDELIPMDVAGRVEVAIDPARVREIGVVSVPVRRRTVSGDLRAPAEVELDAGRVAVVDTRLAGWITRLRVRTTGERVRRGQALATLTSTDLYEAETQLVAARQAAAALGAPGTALVAQARARLAAIGVPRGEIERVAGGGAAASQLTLRAPRDGTVVALAVSEGAYVAPGTALITIADLDRVWVLAEVREEAPLTIHPGDEVMIATAAGAESTGRVELVEPVIDPRTRTRRIRIAAAGGASLVPGATATVRLGARDRSVVVVPRDAVLRGEGTSHVFVDLGEGRFVPRPIQVGAELGEDVEVRGGIAEGDRVAAVAAFMIDAESQLRAGAGGAR